MKSARIFPGCKLNLDLHILGTTENGFHFIDSLFVPLSSPCDELKLENIEDEPGLNLLCDTLNNQDNILLKTYKIYGEATNFKPGVFARLIKHIPSGAGLGGGSSDAASFLIWLNGLNNTNPLSTQNLILLAKKIGADVPFFIINKPCIVTGIGEILEPVQLPSFYISLIVPPIFILTKWAFNKFDYHQENFSNLLKKGLTKEERLNYKFFSDFQNDLERVVFAEYPELREIKQKLLDLGAQHAAMSGSGSGIFGIFGNRESAENCVNIMKKTYKHVYFNAIQISKA